jgi:hypothetical protein
MNKSQSPSEIINHLHTLIHHVYKESKENSYFLKRKKISKGDKIEES